MKIQSSSLLSSLADDDLGVTFKVSMSVDVVSEDDDDADDEQKRRQLPGEPARSVLGHLAAGKGSHN